MAADDRLWFADGLELLGQDDAEPALGQPATRGSPATTSSPSVSPLRARDASTGIGSAFAAVLR